MEKMLIKRFFCKAVDTVFKQILKFSAPNQFSISFLKYVFCSVHVNSQYVASLLCISYPYRSPRSKQASLTPSESAAAFTPWCCGTFVGPSKPSSKGN